MLKGFNRERTYKKLVDAIKRGLVSGDISDEETARTKGVVSLYIKVNSDKVSFQISPYGKLTISHSDNSKLRKARSKLKPLLPYSEWVPKYVPNDKEWSQAKFQERKIHSDDLKKVITQWINELPFVNEKFEIVMPSSVSINSGDHFYEWHGKLPVESNGFFLDLRNHLGANVFTLWKRFRDNAQQLQKNRKVMMTDFNSKVERKIGLPLSAKWKNDVVMDNLSVLLVRLIARYIIQGQYPQRYELEMEELIQRSSVDKKEDCLEFWMDGRGYVKVSNASTTETDQQFLERIQGCMRQLVKEAEEYSSKIAKIQKLGGILANLREDIKSELSRQLRFPVLRGDCDYLRGEF